MDIKQFQEECGAIARENGFWDAHENLDKRVAAAFCKLGLIHSEVTEALEALRDMADDELGVKTVTHLQINDFTVGAVGDTRPRKPEGLASELADIIIRVLDMAEWLGFDMAEVLEAKSRYNATRGYMHGRGA